MRDQPVRFHPAELTAGRWLLEVDDAWLQALGDEATRILGLYGDGTVLDPLLHLAQAHVARRHYVKARDEWAERTADAIAMNYPSIARGWLVEVLRGAYPVPAPDL